MAAKQAAKRKKKKDRKKTGTHWLEVAGIVVLGVAVFLACCLLTYNPADPSFETGIAGPPPTIHNWGKQIGAYVSSLLFQIFGLGAHLFPVVLLLLAVKVLFRPLFAPLFYIRVVVGLLVFICAEIFLSLCFGKLNGELYAFDAGGALVGGWLAAYLVSAIGTFGSYLGLLVVLLVVIMGLTRISYVGVSKQVAGAVGERVKEPLGRGVLWMGTAGRLIRGWRTAFSLRRQFDKKKKTALRPALVPELPAPAPSAPVLPEELMQPRLPFNDITVEMSPDDIPITIYNEGEQPEDEQDFEPVEQQITEDYRLPSLDLLAPPSDGSLDVDRDALMRDAEILVQKLADFGVKGRVVEINPGPVITRFEVEPAPGIKLNRIVGLADDLALALKALSVRIAAIPGKSVVGIEVPNKKRKTVSFYDIVSRDEFIHSSSMLTLGLGKDIAGQTAINDLSRMPHLLVAGTTGSGKSVFVNTVICSILYKATPDDVKFLMVDPKRLELFPYDGIPHLLHPVVVDPKKAAVALRWAVEEMERRYKMLAAKGTRDIVQYNKKIEKEIENWGDAPDKPKKMSYIVVVIDELADLMMIAARDVESYIARLAQMARASGIHLLIATQRPSVDILTGVIKANFPSRISFQVSSKVDSRTILDIMGAEKLLGMGDMLFIPPGTSRLLRIHGAFISEKEIHRVTEFIKAQGQPIYDESIVALKEEESALEEGEEYDELYDKAVAFVTDTGQASISMVQRKLKVGYNRAARMVEVMEREGVVGPSDGVKARQVLVNKM
ncbi:MAG: hypothetical protein GY868_20205 [Deltaproteobacteria bacterium]|nr:hypothetical protein [Deltaproteobacteria bacterium]